MPLEKARPCYNEQPIDYPVFRRPEHTRQGERKTQYIYLGAPFNDYTLAQEGGCLINQKAQLQRRKPRGNLQPRLLLLLGQLEPVKIALSLVELLTLVLRV